MHKDEAHPFHPYLSALPHEAPDPCAWPSEQRALLAQIDSLLSLKWLFSEVGAVSNAVRRWGRHPSIPCWLGTMRCASLRSRR